VPVWAWVAVAIVVAVGLGVAFLGRTSQVLPAEQAPSDVSSEASAKGEVPLGGTKDGRIASPIAAPAKSIAVLPFENRSDQKEDQYFTDGIHDDLLTHISRIRDIKTISRTSVMAYRDTTKNMKQIGEELGVATILEGGVQRAGKQVRINVQLIDAATDAHLWAEIYTRELTAENIFAIQSEISEAITGALKAVLSPEEQQQFKKLPTQNMAALEAYFRGRSSYLLSTSEGFSEAITTSGRRSPWIRSLPRPMRNSRWP
jgi:TolB-like protein